MKELRYNIYSRIHKRLRTILLDAGLKIQYTDFTDPNEASETFESVKHAIASFENYIRKEDHMILHTLAIRAPYLVALSESSNEKNLRLSRGINKLVGRFKSIGRETEKHHFGNDLQIEFFEFMAAVLLTMNKEETVINDLLWANFSDAELKAIESSLIKKATEEMHAAA